MSENLQGEGGKMNVSLFFTHNINGKNNSNFGYDDTNG